MKVHVYMVGEGQMDVMVEPSSGSGLSPVILQDVKPEDVVDRVGSLVVEVRQKALANRGQPR